MPRIFVGNFDFERELLHPGERFPPLTPAAAGLEFTWRALANPDDVIHIASDPPPDAPDAGSPQWVNVCRSPREWSGYELVPWGWSRAAVRLAATLNPGTATPPEEVVRRVNSRSFRLALEREFDAALPTACTIDSGDDLQQAIRSLAPDTGWVVKGHWGAAGRDRLLGRGPSFGSQQANWLRRQLDLARPLVFEPWLSARAEAGIQFDIPRRGATILCGVTPLLSDPQGQYRGSRLQSSPELHDGWQPAIELGFRIAERLQHLGYFGPLGVDAMQYRTDFGGIGLRPLQDLNARFTMGRLALGWRRELQPGEFATWWHGRQPLTPTQHDELEKSPLGRILRTGSPAPNCRSSYLLVATNSSDLTSLERLFEKISRSGTGDP